MRLANYYRHHILIISTLILSLRLLSTKPLSPTEPLYRDEMDSAYIVKVVEGLDCDRSVGSSSVAFDDRAWIDANTAINNLEQLTQKLLTFANCTKSEVAIRISGVVSPSLIIRLSICSNSMGVSY